MLSFHGNPGSRLSVWGGVGAMRATGVRLITVDRPGIGRSDPKPGRTVAGWASDADELADHLDLERFAVLGEMFTEGLKGVPIGIRDLRKIRDYDAGWHDHLPFLYSFLAYAHRAKLNLRDREPLHRGDGRRHHLGGEPIAGLNPEDSKFLDQLEAEGLDPR